MVAVRAVVDSDTADRANEYSEQGYTVFRNCFSKSEAAALLEEVERCAALDDFESSLSAKGIRYSGAVFLRSEICRSMLTDRRIIDLITPIAGGDLWVCMDQAVTKYPGAGVFRWHQDNGYNRLRREHFQLWIALTPTRKKNGALTLAPGSHKRGLLPHTYAGVGQMEVAADIGETVTIDADAGDVILFSSMMLHCTGPNEADTQRVAYVAEYMRMQDFAPKSTPPYFVAATGGEPNPHFTNRKPGARSVRNQLMYLGPRIGEAMRSSVRSLRKTLRGGGRDAA